MRRNGIFDAAAATALVNSSANWEPGDIIEHGGHFMSFFRADGKNPDRRKILKAVTQFWNEHNDLEIVPSEGFFVLDEALTVHHHGVARRSSFRPHAGLDPEGVAVGVVAADVRMLANQFNHAKKILHRLGVCNDDLPCKLKAQSDEEDMVVVQRTTLLSKSSKLAAKLGFKLPSKIPFESALESENTKEFSDSLAKSNAWKLDQSAMKSGLLMNQIALSAGTMDLARLNGIQAQSNILFKSFCKGRNQDVILDQAHTTLSRLQQDKQVLMGAVAGLFDQAKETMDRHWVAPHNRPELQAQIFVVGEALDQAIEACSAGQVDVESFRLMRDLQVVGQQLMLGSWFDRLGDFGAHALLLSACYDEAIAHQETLVELMRAEINHSVQERATLLPAPRG